MRIVYERCCGVDVHKESIVACYVGGQGEDEIRTFGTMTADLLGFCDWLKEKRVEMVAMESTASYWKPVYNLLEVQGIPAILVNARHIKNVPGRKTDVNDSQWIADLLRHGLLKASFVQKREDRETKELVRYRGSEAEERARAYNRLDKVLQGANIKLSSVASRMDTKSGMEMIKALADGVVDEELLASLAKGSMRKKHDELKKALSGLIQPHQRLMIKSMLDHIEYLDTLIARLDEEIDRRLSGVEAIVEALDGIPGVGRQSAQAIIAEIGTDMSVFPSAKHLASWSGTSPGQNESGGKKKHAKTRKGNSKLKKTLVLCGRAAGRAKNTYYGSMYAKIASRRGKGVAAMAVARSIIEACYYMIRDNVPYCELGKDYLEKRNKEDIMRRSVKRLESLGFKVSLEEIA